MKNTREIASEYRMNHRAGIMRERAESGLSIRAYCAREGMHVNRYHYWQRRLRAAAAQEMLPPKAEITPVPTGWTQVMPLEESDKSIAVKTMNSPEVTIEIGKSRITASESTDMELLSKVCKVLVTIC